MLSTDVAVLHKSPGDLRVLGWDHLLATADVVDHDPMCGLPPTFVHSHPVHRRATGPSGSAIVSHSTFPGWSSARLVQCLQAARRDWRGVVDGS